jgi:hypothetical protein
VAEGGGNGDGSGAGWTLVGYLLPADAGSVRSCDQAHPKSFETAGSARTERVMASVTGTAGSVCPGGGEDLLAQSRTKSSLFPQPETRIRSGPSLLVSTILAGHALRRAKSAASGAGGDLPQLAVSSATESESNTGTKADMGRCLYTGGTVYTLPGLVNSRIA